MGSGGPFSGGKARPGRVADHPPASTPPLPQSTSMACIGAVLALASYLSNKFPLLYKKFTSTLIFYVPLWKQWQRLTQSTNSIQHSLHEEFTVSQLFKKRTAFYGTRNLITVFTRAQPVCMPTVKFYRKYFLNNKPPNLKKCSWPQGKVILDCINCCQFQNYAILARRSRRRIVCFIQVLTAASMKMTAFWDIAS
jgi:hypothetical protein